MVLEGNAMKIKALALALALCLGLGAACLAEGEIHTTYDGDDQLIQEDFVLEDGSLAVGPDGFARHRLSYDDSGRLAEEVFYNERLEPAPNGDGVVIARYAYEGEGDKPSVVMYFDAAGQPMLYEALGAYGERLAYDEKGRVSMEELLDADGNPMAGKAGWTRAEYVNFDSKRKLSERYYDQDGNPFLLKKSYSGIDREYNEDKRVTRMTYHDATGNVGPNKDGVITQLQTFEDGSKPAVIMYLDASDQPMIYEKLGAYGERLEYDENKLVSMEQLLDADGNPMAGAAGWTRVASSRARKRSSWPVAGSCVSNSAAWVRMYLSGSVISCLVSTMQSVWCVRASTASGGWSPCARSAPRSPRSPALRPGRG